ncbi:MAG: LysR family transcriptional regulator [Cypionkella sp.]
MSPFGAKGEHGLIASSSTESRLREVDRQPPARHLQIPDDRHHAWLKDLALIKTFLEVSASGSFISASERLFGKQSAVSLRVQRFEDQLGRPLFLRFKSGVELTPADKEFEKYVNALLRNWAQARQQVSIPEGYTQLTIGAQVSLGPRLGFRWIDKLRAELPDLGLRVQLDLPETLTRAMIEGVMQISMTYSPTLRPGL